MDRRRLFIEWLLIGLGVTFVLALLTQWEVTERADRLVYDWASPLRAAPIDTRIAIVAIDHETLAGIGRWPWSRNVHARAIANIQKAKPRAIIYNILFLQPGEEDATLAAALRGGAPVDLPMLIDEVDINGGRYTLHKPVPMLARAAGGVGTVNLDPDSDGQTRRIALATPLADVMYPHVAEYAYRQVTGHSSPAYERNRATGEKPMVPFHSPDTFRAVRFLDAYQGAPSLGMLKDRIVIVGATAEGMGDLYPVAGRQGDFMSGAEIQANLLSAMFSDQFIRPLSPLLTFFLSMPPIWVLLVAFWRLNPSQGFWLSGVTMAATFFLCFGLMRFFGLWFPPITALLGVAVIYPLWSWRRLSAVNQFIVREVDGLLARPDIPALPEPRSRWTYDRISGDAVRLHRIIELMHRNAQQREEMLEFLSHDMRSPQAAIVALLEMEGKDATAKPHVAARIRRYAEHTLQLADDFVQIARLQAQGRSMEPADLADVMTEGADILWAAAKARSVRIVSEETEESHVWVLADGAALVRAFANLFNNAVQATPQGGTVRYGVRLEDGAAVGYVTDEGPGLPPERRNAPFARFGHREGTQGAGLGLAYVEAVARYHGGEASYEDAGGGGACFAIRLPLAPDE